MLLDVEGGWAKEQAAKEKKARRMVRDTRDREKVEGRGRMDLRFSFIQEGVLSKKVIERPIVVGAKAATVRTDNDMRANAKVKRGPPDDLEEGDPRAAWSWANFSAGLADDGSGEWEC